MSHFEPGPPPDARLGGEVIYYRKDRKTGCEVSGETYGKLVLVGIDGKKLDPSYVVLDYYGRFYLNVAQEVARDAAASLRTGREPRYTPLPMQHVPDPRKGERNRIIVLIEGQ
jgi:hypothetical protein